MGTTGLRTMGRWDNGPQNEEEEEKEDEEEGWFMERLAGKTLPRRFGSR